jgi:ATP-dependent exoDNAse (exonuclease V) beta subunit
LPAVSPVFPSASRQRLAGARFALVAELAAVASPGSSVTECLSRLELCGELMTDEHLWPAELDRVRLRGNGAALSTDACGEYRDALEAYQAELAAQSAAPVRDALDDLLVRFGKGYTARKRGLSGLDFEDLELLTLELLRTHPSLRERYAQRFDRIMVDEQQDTNRVQLELIEAIARENLFTVGDVQQSIYRFRHADVSLFASRGQRLAADGRRLTLQTNFRSRPELLDVIGEMFAAELGEPFAPPRPGRESAGTDHDPRVELLLVDKGAEWELEGMAAPWRLAEARALAERIAALVAAGARPGEIVVLIRATTDMRAYERALEAHGLPTYVVGGRGYWSHPQVLDMVAYLRVLANPLDDEALYAALASPLAGASLDALVILGDAGRAAETTPWGALAEPGSALDELEGEDRRRLAAFASWVSAERAHGARRGPAALLSRVLVQTGYDEAMLALPGGRRRLANVRKLLRLAGEHEREHGPDLAGFARLVTERAAGLGADVRESEAPVEGDGVDAVRVMTIHRAKGLEWPIVCVADLGRSPRPAAQILRVGSGDRIGLRLSRPGARGRVNALEYRALRDEERQADEAEERRLFYVAMTRARERLILSGATRFDGWTGAASSNGGGPVGWLGPALVPELGRWITAGGGLVQRGDHGVLVRIAEPGGLRNPVVSPSPAAAGPQAEPAVGRPARAVCDVLPAARGPAPPATLSYSALEAHRRCGYRFYAERVLGLPERSSATAESPGESRPAADRGVVLHALLEKMSFRRPRVPGRTELDWVIAAAGQSPAGDAEADALLAVVEHFAASDLCGRLGGLLDARREQRFAFALRDGPLMTGVLDVLGREAGGSALVVDYKSDRVTGVDLAELTRTAYGTQRLVYALAALHSGATRVEVVHCFLDRSEEPVSVIYEVDQREPLQAELERMATGILESQFVVAADPHRSLCAGCAAEGGLCSWPLAMTRRETVDRLF